MNPILKSTLMLCFLIAGSYIGQSQSNNSWRCVDVELSKLLQKNALPYLPNIYKDTVSIQFIIAKSLYTNWGSNYDQVLQKVGIISDSLLAIYSRELIPLKIQQIDIDYGGDHEYSSIAQALLSIQSTTQDLSQTNMTILLTAQAELEGGIAFRGGICNRANAFAVCQVTGDFKNYSSYSKDIHVLSHEVGHIFGSAHTHDCVWGPEQKAAIDGCAINSCDRYDFPADGGTIMSYCQDSPQGVDLMNGFGLEPGNLIRSNYNSCKSFAGDKCETAIEITNNPSSNSVIFVHDDSESFRSTINSQWYQFNVPSDGLLSVSSCNQGVDTKLNVYIGNCESKSIVATCDDECLSENGYYLAASIQELPVMANRTVFIEWTNQWSNDPFKFDFVFVSLFSDCPESDNPGAYINTAAQLYSDLDIQYAGMIDSFGSLMIVSPLSVSFESGFEIMDRGSLEVQIGDCHSLPNN